MCEFSLENGRIPSQFTLFEFEKKENIEGRDKIIFIYRENISHIIDCLNTKNCYVLYLNSGYKINITKIEFEEMKYDFSMNAIDCIHFDKNDKDKKKKRKQ